MGTGSSGGGTSAAAAAMPVATLALLLVTLLVPTPPADAQMPRDIIANSASVGDGAASRRLLAPGSRPTAVPAPAAVDSGTKPHKVDV
jgi:hypothetical protein